MDRELPRPLIMSCTHITMVGECGCCVFIYPPLSLGGVIDGDERGGGAAAAPREMEGVSVSGGGDVDSCDGLNGPTGELESVDALRGEEDGVEMANGSGGAEA